MQATIEQTQVTQTPALAPAAQPAPAVAQTVTFTDVSGVTQTLPIPLSRQAVADLRARRSELSNQLTSAANRRHKLSEEIKSAPAGASRTGLEQRIGVLDQRMVQLESDIAATGKQLSVAPLGRTSTGADLQSGDIPQNVALVSIASIVMVGFPLAFALARLIWKRGTRVAVAPAQLNEATSQRLERLEQGVDAIAIEIERVAEGQRFVTRLLSEGQTALRLGQHGEEKVSAGRD